MTVVLTGLCLIVSFPDSLLSSLPLLVSHPALRLRSLAARDSVIFDNTLRQILLYNIIQLNLSPFAGVFSEASLRFVLTLREHLLAVSFLVHYGKSSPMVYLVVLMELPAST